MRFGAAGRDFTVLDEIDAHPRAQVNLVFKVKGYPLLRDSQ
jgi:hypothetical protein